MFIYLDFFLDFFVGEKLIGKKIFKIVIRIILFKLVLFFISSDGFIKFDIFSFYFI